MNNASQFGTLMLWEIYRLGLPHMRLKMHVVYHCALFPRFDTTWCLPVKSNPWCKWWVNFNCTYCAMIYTALNLHVVKWVRLENTWDTGRFAQYNFFSTAKYMCTYLCHHDNSCCFLDQGRWKNVSPSLLGLIW